VKSEDVTAKKLPPRARRALCDAGIMCAVALVLWLVFHKTIMATVVLIPAALVLIGGLWFAPLYSGFRKAGTWSAKALGIVLTWILLVPFFYLCFPVGRLLITLSRKDPLHREFLPKDRSYWSEHRPLPEAQRYQRQY